MGVFINTNGDPVRGTLEYEEYPVSVCEWMICEGFRCDWKSDLLTSEIRHGLPIHRRRAAKQHDRGTQHRDAERRADDSSAGESARPRARVVLGGISGPVEYGDGEDAQDVGTLVEGAVATTAYCRRVDSYCHIYFHTPRP